VGLAARGQREGERGLEKIGDTWLMTQLRRQAREVLIEARSAPRCSPGHRAHAAPAEIERGRRREIGLQACGAWCLPAPGACARARSSATQSGGTHELGSRAGSASLAVNSTQLSAVSPGQGGSA